jgi:glucose/arabinose dehydrogenase
LGARTRTTRWRRKQYCKKKGANYGWPVAHGIDYDNAIIVKNNKKTGIQDPDITGRHQSLQVEWHL